MTGALSEGRFRRTRVVDAADCDELGHVNNVAWVRFVVELATAHADAVGWGGRALAARGASWIVARQEIDYRASALPGERLREETWVAAMRGARSLRETRILRESDAALLLRARTTWAFVDAATQRPRRMPPELVAAFPPIEGSR